ncbi:MAG: hypothetical protein U0797_25900 [Gemmataceae bacterium]
MSADGQLAVAGYHLSPGRPPGQPDQGIELRTLTSLDELRLLPHGRRGRRGDLRRTVCASCTGNWDPNRRVLEPRRQGAGPLRRPPRLVGLALRRRRGPGSTTTALSASENGWLCVWDAATERELARYHHGRAWRPWRRRRTAAWH